MASARNKIFNVLPGKHVLDLQLANREFRSESVLSITLEAKAGAVAFLCYDMDYEKKQWKPRAEFPPAAKIETETVLGIFNVYMKEPVDRMSCFLQ
ncbi:MAG: hypothetical protein HY042_00940 [Spirochaetia bacterium]|nr:hypothetical protein [Spirochaetia bacterium]